MSTFIKILKVLCIFAWIFLIVSVLRLCIIFYIFYTISPYLVTIPLLFVIVIVVIVATLLFGSKNQI